MGYKVCVLRAPGTNCDKETAYCVESFGLEAPVIHIKRFMDGDEKFSEYDGLIIPGGFSFGDHVRAGALLGKRLKERFTNELLEFTEDKKPILGICNGFQVLVECGILPGADIKGALTTNLSSKFECRWVQLKVNETNCIFTRNKKNLINIPVAHGEGRFLVETEDLETLERNNQIVFRYVLDSGEEAKGRYPENPNGSINDIAGLSNESGTVLGLMPHPERAFHTFTNPRWTYTGRGDLSGDGYTVFKNMADYIRS